MTKLSTRGMIDIVSHEGICLEPYLDSVGVWTIGIGQTKSDDIDPRTVGKLTLQQAIDLFKRKIKQYTDAVDALGLDLTQYQYDALTSLCYNFGPGNLRQLCRNRSIPQIGQAIMLYTKPPEITERREKEQKLFTRGIYSNANGKILVFPVVNNHPRYRDGYMVDVRPYFEDAPPSNDTQVPPPTVRRGSQGEYVKLLQLKLGFSGDELDGDFGPMTEAALKAHQLAHSLAADGVCGPLTWASFK